MLSVLIAVLAVPCARAAADDNAEPNILEVQGSGYSRFEFDGSEVVTFHTNGVEFSYMGFKVVSEELRYNHANKSVAATGNIELRWDDGSIRTESMQIDSSAGIAETSCIHGSAADIGVSYKAEAANVQFPCGTMQPAPEDVTGQLSSVVAQLPHDMVLHVDTIDYFGPKDRCWLLNMPIITGDPGIVDLSDGQVLDLTGLHFTCDKISGKLDEQLMVNEVVMNHISLKSTGIEITAEIARMQGELSGASMDQWNELSAELTPVDICISLNGNHTSLQAARAILTKQHDVFNLELIGRVVIDGTDISLDTEQVVLVFSYTGVAVNAPSDLSLGFDLSAISGITPIDITQAGYQ